MENYFNYFTEIEEYFWKKRGTTLLVSTLDWALIDSWKQAQIPLEAVLKGIDRAFEKFEKRRQKVRQVNSLAYCHQEVLLAAEESQRTQLPHPSGAEAFPRENLVTFLEGNAEAVGRAAGQFAEQGKPESATNFQQIAHSLRELAATVRAASTLDLEETEQRLTVLEEKMFSVLFQNAEERELVAIRQETDRALAPVRQKMSSEQIAHLQKQFLNRKLLEKAGLPRLSLFYL
ncbi:MAG: hypothetical protein HY313_06600 [Acidobacteria bacterium]|nr:hypothetical protein [Acidobacteriota bacterium]